MTTIIRYNTREAAVFLGVQPRTLCNWRKRGGGPLYSKIGRNVRYSQLDLDAFVAAHTYQKIGKKADAPAATQAS